MKTSLAVLFAVAILALSAPAYAQVRPFSQLTANALDAVQPGNVGPGLIQIGLAPDRNDDRGRDRDRDRDRDSQGLGGWGGFGFGYFMPALSGFNGLTEDRGLHASSPLMDTWSGRGFASWDGFRFGGMGGYGSLHVSDVVKGDDRSANLRVGYGGVTFDYLLSLNDRLGILMGGAMGGGGTWISAHGEDLGGDHYWAEYTGFRFFAPEAGISILAMPWVRIELTAQYLFMDINLQGTDFVSDKGNQLVDTDWLGGPVYTMWFLFGHD